MAEKKNKALPVYLVAGLISIFFLLIIYAVNGIYPFGTGSVVCDDMVQQTISNYTYFWDYLRSGGKMSLLFNWETAAGAQILTTGFYILKPWEIVFSLLVPRDGIVNGISFLLIFKIACATLSMLLFVRKRFKIPPYWQVLLSLIYSLSSFILIYYSNMGWIDAAFLFPLVMLGLLYMFDTGKWVPYVLVLTYVLTLSIYIAYMVFLFLLLIGGLYIFFMQEKSTRKMAIIRFGTSSVLSLALSGVITVPTVFYLFRSARNSIDTLKTGSGSQLMDIIKVKNISLDIKQALFLIGTGLLWAIMLMLLVNVKTNKKQCAFFGLSLFILILPAFFENVNLVWHVGTYVGFPFRYLYMLSFVLVWMAGYAIQSGVLLKMSTKIQKISAIIISVFSGCAGVILMFIKVYNKAKAVPGLTYRHLFNEDSALLITVCFFCFLLAYFFALTITNKKVSCIISSVFVLAEAGMCANFSLRINSGREGVPSSYCLDFIDRALEYGEDLPLENDNLTRIKDRDNLMNSNYPMFFKYPAMSNFTHLVSADMTNSMKALGYSQIYTRVNDNPGTILSDMLLNIKYLFTSKELDSDEFSFEGNLGESKLYSYNYTLPVGLVVNEDFKNVDIISNNDPFKSTNQLFFALGGKGKLIETTVEKYDAADEVFVLSKKIEGKKHAYLRIETAGKMKNGSLNITVDGKSIDLSYLGTKANYLYPNNFNNGLLDLGIYENDSVNITIGAWKEIGDSITLTLGEADYSKLKDLCEINKNKGAQVVTGPRSLTAKVTANGDNEYLYLPINDDPGWKCEINGKKTDIDYSLGSFITVKLNQGENTAEFKFLPWGIELGAVISGVSALLFIALIILKKKKNIHSEYSNKFLNVFEKIYFAGMGGVYFVICVFLPACSVYFNR